MEKHQAQAIITRSYTCSEGMDKYGKKICALAQYGNNQLFEMPLTNYVRVTGDSITKSVEVPKSEEVERNIANFIGTFTLDINQPESRKIFVASYVTNERYFKQPSTPKEVLKSIHPDAINFSRKTIRKFHSEICELAKTISKKTKENAIDRVATLDKGRIFIVGPKGVGKTTFLNMIRCKHYNKHVVNRQSRIVFVYFDLTEYSIKNLSDGLQFCTTREILANWSHYLQVNISSTNQILKEMIKGNNAEIKNFTDEQYQYLWVNIYSECTGTSPRNDSKISWIFDSLIKYLIEYYNLSFIFTIDGLDRINLTPSKVDNFHNWCDQIKNSFLSNSSYPGVYLVSMRTESMQSIGNLPLRQYRQEKISETWPKQIMRRRISLLEHYLRQMKNSKEDDIERNVKLSVGYVKFLVSALADRFVGASNDLFNNNMCEILNFFNRNFRRCFEALKNTMGHFIKLRKSGQLSAVDILELGMAEPPLGSAIEDKLKKYSYVAVEGFLLAGKYFALPQYKYDFDPVDNKFFRSIEYPKVTYYLPNLFKFPYADGINSGNYVLCGIRIIQYILLHKNMENKSRIVDFLNDYFGYPAVVVETMMEELVENNILFYNELAPQTDYFSITEAAIDIYNNLIGDLEYSYLCCQSVPLPLALLQGGYFDILPFGMMGYVMTKLRTTANFIKYLKCIDIQEEYRFNRHASDVKSGFLYNTYSPNSNIHKGYKDKGFAFSERMCTNFRVQMHKIVGSEWDRKDSTLKDDLEIYLGELS